MLENAAASRAETRRRLLEAAGAEFAEHGYRAATVKRIAERAGVTVQTLYLAWTSKATLLRAHLESSLAGEPDADYAAAIAHAIDVAVRATDGDAHRIVVECAHLFRLSAERAAPAWKLYRDAAATDPAIADDWHNLQQLRHQSFERLIGQLPPAALRAGMSPGAAVETAWVIASPETYELYVENRGHALDDYEAWLTATLAAALLDDPPMTPHRPRSVDH